MYTVYVLSDGQGRLYKGYTVDLSRRLREHRSGHTRTTRQMDQLSVVYTETQSTLEAALMRERYFKSAAGRRLLKTLLS